MTASKFQCLLTVQSEKQTICFFSGDSLTIYDGGSSTSTMGYPNMMGRYCGFSIPPSHISSSSNEILIHFKTDDNDVDDFGFKMEYNPSCKQNKSIQNNGNSYRILRTIFISKYFCDFFNV